MAVRARGRRRGRARGGVTGRSRPRIRVGVGHEARDSGRRARRRRGGHRRSRRARRAARLHGPARIAGGTLAEAATVQFPGLDGVLPGFGRQTPNDWGLGLELRDGKAPHWTGTRNSPRTFGHFGRSGTFLWVDPDAGVALACLTDLAFGDWARDAWPRLSDAVLSDPDVSRDSPWT